MNLKKLIASAFGWYAKRKLNEYFDSRKQQPSESKTSLQQRYYAGEQITDDEIRNARLVDLPPALIKRRSNLQFDVIRDSVLASYDNQDSKVIDLDKAGDADSPETESDAIGSDQSAEAGDRGNSQRSLNDDLRNVLEATSKTTESPNAPSASIAPVVDQDQSPVSSPKQRKLPEFYHRRDQSGNSMAELLEAKKAARGKVQSQLVRQQIEVWLKEHDATRGKRGSVPAGNQSSSETQGVVEQWNDAKRQSVSGGISDPTDAIIRTVDAIRQLVSQGEEPPPQPATSMPVPNAGRSSKSQPTPPTKSSVKAVRPESTMDSEPSTSTAESLKQQDSKTDQSATPENNSTGSPESVRSNSDNSSQQPLPSSGRRKQASLNAKNVAERNNRDERQSGDSPVSSTPPDNQPSSFRNDESNRRSSSGPESDPLKRAWQAYQNASPQVQSAVRSGGRSAGKMAGRAVSAIPMTAKVIGGLALVSGVAVGAIGLFAAKVKDVVGGLGKMNDSVAQMNRGLSHYNGSLATAYALSDQRDIERDIERGAEMSGPLSKLLEERSELKDGMAKVSVPVDKIQAAILAKLTEIANDMGQAINEQTQATGWLNLIADKVTGDDGEPKSTAWQSFFHDVSDGKFDGVKPSFHGTSKPLLNPNDREDVFG